MAEQRFSNTSLSGAGDGKSFERFLTIAIFLFVTFILFVFVSNIFSALGQEQKDEVAIQFIQTYVAGAEGEFVVMDRIWQSGGFDKPDYFIYIVMDVISNQAWSVLCKSPQPSKFQCYDYDQWR